MTENQTGKETTLDNVDNEQTQAESDTAIADAISEELTEIEMLQAELDEARSIADEYLDGWQRARADFQNYKKRIEREQKDVYQTAAGNILKRFLDVLDDMELALENRPQDGNGEEFANGIELIYQKLIATLEKEGVSLMDIDGQEFDPTFHEALSSEDSEEYESGEIIAVVKSGYLLGDRVLRPAMVRVAR
ncbi:MAG: nucleotide exchange factor GrpE [Chloroflexota bacterium]|nr:nucleotide exchange factor GrpE [Chloroflexota bacterium]